MQVVVPVALALLCAWGLHLLRLEWKRFAVDKKPAPAPTPEEASLERWSAGVVMLVAGLSIVGAVMAFWASGKFSDANDLSQQAVQEVTQYQTIKGEQDGYLSFGERLTESLQEESVAESSAFSQAAAAWSGGQYAQAEALEARARVAAAGQRALAGGYLCYWMTTFGPGGSVVYNVSQQQVLEAERPCTWAGQDDTALRTLANGQANSLESAAETDRSHAEDIVLAGAFLILAVFFMTISYLGRKHRRLLPLTAGVGAMALALGVSTAVALA
ncbi:MAG TPA: hypothetical protein VME46_22425 [Acidimicrobiales bacterium]|nr:hypothetical protein [Acidimicrobiales bacterium]